MIKKTLAIIMIMSMALGLFVGCGCSNGVSDAEKDKKRQDIQKLLKKNKMPFDIKRDEKTFELTETQNTILLQNASNTKDKDSLFLFNYMKWNQQQEDEKDSGIRKNVDNSQKLTKKFPKFKKGKIKKIHKKAMYVQHGKIKKGHYKGWYGAEISFQDETDKNNKQLLLVYLITRSKKTKKQIRNFTSDFFDYDEGKTNNQKKKQKTKDIFDLGV